MTPSHQPKDHLKAPSFSLSDSSDDDENPSRGHQSGHLMHQEGSSPQQNSGAFASNNSSRDSSLSSRSSTAAPSHQYHNSNGTRASPMHPSAASNNTNHNASRDARHHHRNSRQAPSAPVQTPSSAPHNNHPHSAPSSSSTTPSSYSLSNSLSSLKNTFLKGVRGYGAAAEGAASQGKDSAVTKKSLLKSGAESLPHQHMYDEHHIRNANISPSSPPNRRTTATLDSSSPQVSKRHAKVSSIDSTTSQSSTVARRRATGKRPHPQHATLTSSSFSTPSTPPTTHSHHANATSTPHTQKISHHRLHTTHHAALASPQNLVKLKSYIKTLRSQYSILSHHYSLQQEDILLMRKEMAFMEHLLEKRMNRIRQLELEKRLESDEFLSGTQKDQETGEKSPLDRIVHEPSGIGDKSYDSHNASTTEVSPSSGQQQDKNAERFKKLDNILNTLYAEKLDRRITFIEEDEHITREELIAKLKLENQQLKEQNQRLEKENTQWARQISIKQEELDRIKSGGAAASGSSPGGISRDTSSLRPKSMVIASSDLASIFSDRGTPSSATTPRSTLLSPSGSDVSNRRGGKKVSFSSDGGSKQQDEDDADDDVMSNHSGDTLPLSDTTVLSDEEDESEAADVDNSLAPSEVLKDSSEYSVVKIDDSIEHDASNEVITFSDSDSDSD